MTRVFSSNEIRFLERLPRPRAQIAQVADRSRHNLQPARCLDHSGLLLRKAFALLTVDPGQPSRITRATHALHPFAQGVRLAHRRSGATLAGYPCNACVAPLNWPL